MLCVVRVRAGADTEEEGGGRMFLRRRCSRGGHRYRVPLLKLHVFKKY